MRFIFALFTILGFAQFASAEATSVGCTMRSYGCRTAANGTVLCQWNQSAGRLLSVDLQKTTAGPGYEIWSGLISGAIDANYPFKLSVAQRRQGKEKTSTLNVELSAEGIKVISIGDTTVEARYLVEAEGHGIGIRCSVDVAKFLGPQ